MAFCWARHMKVAVKVREVQHAAKSREPVSVCEWGLYVVFMGCGYVHTSNFIRAFRPHALEIELSDLRFLT